MNKKDQNFINHQLWIFYELFSGVLKWGEKNKFF